MNPASSPLFLLPGLGMNFSFDVTEMAVRAQVVHASHMVVVVVGDEYAVNLSERLGENLFTEVGTAVDEQACGMRFYER